MHVSYSMIGLSLVLLVTTAGCSTFNREWRAAANWNAPTPAIAGVWSGTWNSTASGHQGALRAIVTPIDESTVQVQFKARFWGIFTHRYSLDLEVEPKGPGEWHFAGGSDLGWLAGGVYECKGVATADELRAEYQSKRDHGTFSLSRPTIEP